jgi:hypothetical protein
MLAPEAFQMFIPEAFQMFIPEAFQMFIHGVYYTDLVLSAKCGIEGENLKVIGNPLAWGRRGCHTKSA